MDEIPELLYHTPQPSVSEDFPSISWDTENHDLANFLDFDGTDYLEEPESEDVGGPDEARESKTPPIESL